MLGFVINPFDNNFDCSIDRNGRVYMLIFDAEYVKREDCSVSQPSRHLGHP